MGILRLRVTLPYFKQITVFCTSCGKIIPYYNVDTDHQYYEDIESGEVYCVECIDSGKTMSNPSSKVKLRDVAKEHNILY